jgi:hypothetical protein
MKIGARACLLVSEHGILVPTRAPYGRREAIEHLLLVERDVAERLKCVTVDVTDVESFDEVLRVANAPTLPPPAPGDS